jgi:hypothetical protein
MPYKRRRRRQGRYSPAPRSETAALAVPVLRSNWPRPPTVVPPLAGRVRLRLSLPLLALGASLGLASVAIADAGSRRGISSLAPLFWIGLLLIFSPIACRVLSRSTTRQERLLLVLLLGVSLYLIKVLALPNAFSFVDEFIHLRTTQDILRTHRLFTFTPLLPASAFYPGLKIAASDIVDLTGISPFFAGLLLVGLSRVLFCASFFFVAERATRSSRAAAAATLIYMGNPLFLFWSTYFSYENLALPLAVFLVWWLSRTRRERSLAPLAIAALVIVAVTITHHVVGFALAALLAAWWLAEKLTRHSALEGRKLGAMALFSALTALTWLLTVARPAIAYLWTENIYPGLSQTVSVLLGHLAPRPLYSSAGNVAPLWERLAGFGGVAVLLLALPLGLFVVWRLRRTSPALLVAAVVAATYPLSLLPRLSPAGVAISGRSSEYLYTGLGCVLGLLIADRARRVTTPIRSPRLLEALASLSRGRRGLVLATALMTLVFVGGVTVGNRYNELLPESSHPQGYPWSVQPDVMAAAKWARENLGLNQRFAADVVDAPVLGSYGDQYPVSENLAWPIFLAKTMDFTVVSTIRLARVRYVLVDGQMTLGIPSNPSYYFSPDEPNGKHHDHPLPASFLQKFGSTQCASLIFAAGYVKIFDVAPIANGSCIPGRRNAAA